MAKIKYYFDPGSSQYRRAETSSTDILINLLGITVLAVAIACVFTLLYNNYFESPREMRLSHEVKEMEFHYGELNRKVESLSAALSSVEDRDDNIYRTVLGSSPIDHAIREGGRTVGAGTVSEILE